MNCELCGIAFDVARRRNRVGKYCSRRCYMQKRTDTKMMAIRSGLKLCPRCGVTKSRTEFSPGSSGWDGLHGWCKTCRSEEERLRRVKPSEIQKYRSLYSGDMAFRARSLVNNIEKKCRKEHLAFDLDTEWLRQRLVVGVCELTGLPFVMTTVAAGPYSPSVDRIQAGQGYTKDNCRVVLYSVNRALNHYGLESFLPIAEALVTRHGQRKAVA